MIFKNRLVMIITGITDIFLGVCIMVLPRILPILITGYRDQVFLSESMLVSLAFPFLILLVGVGILLKKDWARVMGFFLALFAMISAVSDFFLIKPSQEIIHTTAQIHVIFSVILPALSIVYFSAHSLVLFFITKAETPLWGGPREQEDQTKRILEQAEYYCANCTKSVSPEAEICPECGAVLKGLHCPGCGYEDAVSRFTDGRCPRCGAEVKSD